MRIVLDTSVLIAALRSRNGAASEVLKLILEGDLGYMMDYKLTCEYWDVALRSDNLQAFGTSPSEVRDILEDLEANALPVRVSYQYRPLSPDQDDDMVLDVAINGQADVLVTNNRKHFAGAARRFGIRVVSPKELLDELRSRRKTDAGN